MELIKHDKHLTLFAFLQDIMRLLRELRNGTSFLAEYEAKLRRENLEYRERYVKRAHDHAMDLMRESIRLERYV